MSGERKPRAGRALNLPHDNGVQVLPALLTPALHAFAAIGVGPTRGYELIASGALVARKVGTSTMIETDSLRRYAAGLPRIQPKECAA